MNARIKLFLFRSFVTALIWIPIAFSLIILFNFAQVGTLGICHSRAGAEVWLDNNGNGIKEVGEPPSSNVCLWANSYSPNSSTDILDQPICNDESDYSDENGLWSVDYMCEADVFVSIKPPSGYKLSTVPLVESKGEKIEFGIVPVSSPTSVGIKEWDYYAEPFEEKYLLQTSITLFVVFCLMLGTIWVSYFFAKKIVK